MSLLSGILGASGASRAGNAISDANIAAEHGVLNTVQNNATNVNAASTSANNTLSNTLGNVNTNLSPYMAAGAQGANSLAQYAASNPQFSFQPTQQQLENTPGYQFQLAQGTNAINNSASAQGLANSGNTLAALTQYGQGLAGTYYQNAFNNAQNTFQTNQNATLANLSALTNTGLSANQQANTAALGVGGQQAGNTLNSAMFNAGQGLQGSQIAGNYAVGAGEGRAAGIMGTNNSLGNMFSGLGSSFLGGMGGDTGGSGILGGLSGLVFA